MPELPEVETLRRAVEPRLRDRVLRQLQIRQPRLRWPVPPEVQQAVGQRVTRVGRRGKYLCFEFEHGVQILHLGMSGSLRWVEQPIAPQPHDHIDWVFDDGILRLHDPRRFGALLWHDPAQGSLDRHPRLIGLGQEPLDPAFDAETLRRGFAGRRLAVKPALLAGDVVVGVGNIYACESLFRAGIRPGVAAGRISAPRLARLASAIRAVLSEAIEAGGSSLRDFSGIDGELGHFQTRCDVYGRAGEPCRVCGQPIRRSVQAQRASYWCAHCQR